MFRLTLATALTLLMGYAYAASTHFYAVGHADDWQLFMNPQAFNDVRRPESKVVFLYLTAGDAGCRTECRLGFRRTPYYLAREFGANRAVRFMAADPAPTIPETSFRILNRKVLNNVTVENTVSYFFRLPDGNPSGSGYPPVNESLQWLYEGVAISDIRNWNRYSDWSDLVTTLQQLVIAEAAGSEEVWVHVQEPDSSLNPDSHSDHVYTARAMLQAVESLTCVGTVNHLDYVTADDGLYAPNVSGDALLANVATWGATVSGLVDWGANSTFDPNHNDWLDKYYISQAVQGVGDCSF